MGDGRVAAPALPPRVVSADDERVLADRPVRKGAWRRMWARDCEPRVVRPLEDHPWDAAGERRTVRAHIKRRLRSYRGLLGVAAAVLLIWIGVSSSVYALLLLAALPVTWLAYGLFRLRTFGATRLTYLEFPYAPSGALRVRFGIDEDGGQFHSARIDLECITERLVPLVVGRWMFCLRLYGDSRQILARHELPEPGSDVELAFEIPPGLPGTHLSAPFPTYWQLRIRGPTTGGPYDETFLLPVYAEDAAR